MKTNMNELNASNLTMNEIMNNLTKKELKELTKKTSFRQEQIINFQEALKQYYPQKYTEERSSSKYEDLTIDRYTEKIRLKIISELNHNDMISNIKVSLDNNDLEMFIDCCQSNMIAVESKDFWETLMTQLKYNAKFEKFSVLYIKNPVAIPERWRVI